MFANAIKTNITHALKEDLGEADLTSNLLKMISRVRFRLKSKKKEYYVVNHGLMSALSK